MKTYQEIMMIAEMEASKVNKHTYGNAPFNYPKWAILCDLNDRFIESYIKKITTFHHPQHEFRFNLVDSCEYMIRTSYSVIDDKRRFIGISIA
jgi:hypothetical protein